MAVQLWKRLLPAGRPPLQPTLKPNAPEGTPNTASRASCSCVQAPRGPFSQTLRGPFSQLSAEDTVLLVSTCSDSVGFVDTEAGGRKLTWCLFNSAGSRRTSCGVFILTGRLPGFQSKSVKQESTLRDTNSLFKRPSASSSLFQPDKLWLSAFMLLSEPPTRRSLLVFQHKEGVRTANQQESLIIEGNSFYSLFKHVHSAAEEEESDQVQFVIFTAFSHNWNILWKKLLHYKVYYALTEQQFVLVNEAFAARFLQFVQWNTEEKSTNMNPDMFLGNTVCELRWGTEELQNLDLRIIRSFMFSSQIKPLQFTVLKPYFSWL